MEIIDETGIYDVDIVDNVVHISEHLNDFGAVVIHKVPVTLLKLLINQFNENTNQLTPSEPSADEETITEQ